MAAITKEILEAAIVGFEAKKQHIETQLAELRAMLSQASDGSVPVSQSRGRKKRRMSAAGRKAIAEAQRKRWAGMKRESSAPTDPQQRKLSTAGRAAIVAALKKRWAARKKAA